MIDDLANPQHLVLTGPAGTLPVPAADEITRKLAMLYEGECEPGGPLAAARKFGFSKPRYYQLRQLLQQHGAQALQSRSRGPKTTYRRTDQVRQLVIRHRFLDPEASPAVLAQKIRQADHPISQRSVQRVIADFGLQKKTLRLAPPGGTHRPGGNPTHGTRTPSRTQRSGKSGTGRAPTPGR